jgi:hypothetical protein
MNLPTLTERGSSRARTVGKWGPWRDGIGIGFLMHHKIMPDHPITLDGYPSRQEDSMEASGFGFASAGLVAAGTPGQFGRKTRQRGLFPVCWRGRDLVVSRQECHAAHSKALLCSVVRNQTLSAKVVSIWCLFLACAKKILAKRREFRDSSRTQYS